MAQFDGASNFPFPTAIGVINGVNGVADFPFPAVSGALLLAIAFDGTADFPFPEAAGRLNQYFDGAAEFPFPSCSGELVLGSAFDGVANFPFPIAQGTMEAVWLGAADFPFPTAVGILAASIPQMEGAASFPFPVAVGILAGAAPDSFTVLVMNLKNKVVSVYENFNFNSACKLNGVYLGAASDGVHTLSGANDGGDPINASIILGAYNFGSGRTKVASDLLCEYSGVGELEVSLSLDQEEEMGSADSVELGPYPVISVASKNLRVGRASLPNGTRGGSWQFKVANVAGGGFDLQSVEIPVEKSQRRLN